jgi:hypothetical protein
MQFKGKSGNEIMEMLLDANTVDEFLDGARVLASRKLVGRTDFFTPVFERLISILSKDIEAKDIVIDLLIGTLTGRESSPGDEVERPYWPATLVVPSDGPASFDGMFEHKYSALLLCGYRVGKTSKLSQNDRRDILVHFMESPLHPSLIAIFGDQYGNPRSLERVLKMANVIATNCKNFKRQNGDGRYSVAIGDYESDLAFLKLTYFDQMIAGNPPLPWPDTDI